MIQTLQQTVSVLTTLLLSLQASFASLPPANQLAQVVPTPVATITITPTTNSGSINSTFNANIIINTNGQSSYGVDINRLRFNPSILQVVDSDNNTNGVQISPGVLMPLTIINSVDNTTGSIQFSQLANPGSTYSGSGTLASVTFRIVGAGSSNITFDFALGNGSDTNVAGLGGDLLSSVSGATYTGTAQQDTIAPSTPGNPSLSVISSSQINLSWTASTDTGGSGLIGYRVERCSGSVACTNYSHIATTTTNSYSNSGLTPSTIYTYRIRAVDGVFNLSSYSGVTSATTQSPPDTTPPSISNSGVSGVSSSGATISWTTNEPADTQVDYGLTPSYGNSTPLNSSLKTSHSVNLTSLSAGTQYNYRLKSRDAAGNLAVSLNNTFTTQTLPDTTAPSVPANLTATSTSESQVQLSWSASTDSAGLGQAISGVSHYQVFRGGVLIATTSATAYLNSNLTPGTSYSYQIAAVDLAGNISIRSNSVSVTTPIYSLSVQRRLIINPEGRPSNGRVVSGTIEFLNPTNLANKIYQASFTTDNNGQYVIDIPNGLLPTVTLRPVVTGYLPKLLNNVDLRNTNLLDLNFGVLLTGDFNGDRIINSLDFSYMNGKWNLSDTLSDVNSDNIVNSLDFAYISNNWLVTGE